MRKIVFANGLMLSLKQTDLQRDRVSIELNIDGGQLLNTREDPLATAMDDVLPLGGLGKHPVDELQSILAGRSVSFSFGADAETFVLWAQTTPRDLDIQLELFAAAVTDPGYRSQGEVQYRRGIENFFAGLTATPEATLGNALGGIVSDDDPRFTLQPKQAYLDLSFARLREAISGRLGHGAMELRAGRRLRRAAGDRRGSAHARRPARARTRVLALCREPDAHLHRRPQPTRPAARRRGQPGDRARSTGLRATTAISTRSSSSSCSNGSCASS